MLVCLMLIISAFDSVFLEDNIFEFSPNQPLCLGEEVNLTCYLFPDTQTYRDLALISFNQSTPESAGTINIDRASIGYSATIAIPIMGSSARIQLTIASFKESDGNTLFGCHAELTSDASVTTAIESGYPPIADPPSAPINVTITSIDCTNSTVSWTAPASDRSIDRYYVSRNSSLLAVTTDTQFTDTDLLLVNTPYEYSVVANSCAGNSSAGVGKTTKVEFMQRLVITYDNNTNTVTINWSLVLKPQYPSLTIPYYLSINYSHSQFNNVSENYTYTYPFSQISTNTTLNAGITAPDFPTSDSVVTNIRVCINAIEKCGLVFEEMTVCMSYDPETVETTPTTLPTSPSSSSVQSETSPTAPNTTSNPNTQATLIVAVAVVVAVVILCGCCAIGAVIILVLICLKQKGQGYSIFSSSKRNNLMTEEGDTKESGGINKHNIEMERNTPQKPELLYAELDLVSSRTGEVSQTVEETHYTAVRPLMDGPRK